MVPAKKEAIIQFIMRDTGVWRVIVVAAMVVVCDQVSKFLFSRMINTGISFGVGGELPAWVVTILIIVVAVASGWWLREVWGRSLMATGLVAGGAIGNLIDRVVFGGVRDWFPIAPHIAILDPYLQTPIYNNVADMAIVFGVGWLLWQLHIKPVR
jgi:lipoprotein signal peptidase